MAKKVEKKDTRKRKAQVNPKEKTSGAATPPETSGEVKGPMGVGGRKKSESGAIVKKPAKNKVTDTGSSPNQTKKPSGPGGLGKETMGKALPEKTSDTEEHLTVTPEKSTSKKSSRSNKVQGMHSKDTSPIILEASTSTEREEAKASVSKTSDLPKKSIRKPSSGPAKSKSPKKEPKPRLTQKVDSEEVKQRILDKKKKVAEEKSEKSSAKKMARRKPEKGISAEEKSKLPDTSLTEDLTEAANKAVNKLADTVIPDKETQEELKEIAKSLLPDQKELEDRIKKKAKTLTPTKEGATDKPVEASLISDYDIHLFKEGRHYHLYKKLGSHLMNYLGTEGVYFALWAPNASEVTVIGDFNDWDRQRNPMRPREDSSGIWEVFIPEAKNGSIYKYFIRSSNGYEVEKGDPYAFLWETPPRTASVVWDLKNDWNDNEWLSRRRNETEKEKAFSIYELHLGSWKRVPEEDARSLTYREMAEDLPHYVKEMGFSHVEFMPVMEHPFFGSWGYQVTGYFAPSSRFGTPQDFMYLIDSLHKEGIGVILDWVPSHFPDDMHGLHYFDGTFLYEHKEKHKGFHPDWQSYIFNYGRNEVRCFLISNALFWLDRFHADGLRVDAVASMLYLDYSREEGEWEPNEHGGRENLEAISFLKELNEVVYREFPDVVTIAEESTAWPMVSRPTYLGGLGFGFKWMMGWMHDTLEYFKKDPIHRRHHQNSITFSLNYAFTENFVLPLSHDEVVYGKQALLNKMPGDQWQQFANLRNLYAYMYAHPGSKLLFMGGEFGQTSEWNHDSSLDWHLLQYEGHEKLRQTVKMLNQLYRSEPALHENLYTHEGFQWLDISDADNSVISFFRKSKSGERILVICNFTPMSRENYLLRLSEDTTWKEIFNSDDEKFGGSNLRNQGALKAESGTEGNSQGITLTLPPLGVLYLKEE